MKECAFCLRPAKMSAEHITSEWMGRLFPAPKEFKSTDRLGKVTVWTASGLDLTAKVVCEKCNNTWMSDVEAQHAEPVMTPLILGDKSAPFRENEAHSLALFAFKTAVILDYAQRHREPFFSRRQRDAFRRHLLIPNTVGMWLAVYIPPNRRRRLDIRVSINDGELSPGYALQTYVCSFGLGYLAFQVVAHKQFGLVDFAPLRGFENLAVGFWPEIEPGYIWPGWPSHNCLRSREEFIAFHERWGDVVPV